MSKARSTSIIDTIIIHCAATPNGACWCAEDIDDWHGENKFLRRHLQGGLTNVSPHLKHIGYHYVIETTGKIVRGRSLSETGAHAKGQNTNSIGICLVGLDKFTHEQWATLKSLVYSLQTRFKHHLKVIGHRDVNKGKTCPGFDVAEWLHFDMAIPNEHLFINFPNHQPNEGEAS